MMDKYGIDNVRGGSFCSINLASEQMNVIKSMINSGNDKCFRCGNSGHLANECSLLYNKNIPQLSVTSSLTQSIKQNNDKCYKCGRDGHYKTDCYAKKDISGKGINNSYFYKKNYANVLKVLRNQHYNKNNNYSDSDSDSEYDY
jgi:Zinc knuckle